MKKKEVKKIYTCPKCKENQNSVLKIYKLIKTHLVNLTTNFSARSGEQVDETYFHCPSCSFLLPRKLLKKIEELSRQEQRGIGQVEWASMPEPEIPEGIGRPSIAPIFVSDDNEELDDTDNVED